jgi:hypothetical protein
MKRGAGLTALWAGAGFLSLPVSAAELRLMGFFDNIFPHVDSHLSFLNRGNGKGPM